MIQWLTIHLPMQGTRVQSLVPELRSHCCRATEPMRHNYWSPHTLEPVLHNKRNHLNEEPMHCHGRIAPAPHNKTESPCTATKTQSSQIHSVVSRSLRPHGLYSQWNSPGPNTGVGTFPFSRGIFLTQGSNPGLPHCRQILYQLSHKRSQEYWSG